MASTLGYIFVGNTVLYFVSLSLYLIFSVKMNALTFNVFFIFVLGILLVMNIYLTTLCIFSDFSFYFTTSNFMSNLGLVDFSFNFSVNLLSSSFSLLVVLIGFTTNVYILNYFKNEVAEKKFIFFINSFILSMLFLIFSNNFYSIFLGWELIGLTSFFLINFWVNKRSTLKSAFKAFTFNLISDIFLLGSFVCFYQATGVSDCDVFMYIVLWEGLRSENLLFIGTVLLALCASIKSVQLFGHLWLPDSMEAPVPASSLIHSATLVSAGIFLLCKFNYLFCNLTLTSWLIAWGSLTAAYGGVVAAAQTDMKKLLAYSTMSHCGFMWILAISGNFYVTIFYLFLHGIFKAATFYCAGSFIVKYNTQDTRLMGWGARLALGDTFLLIVCAANLAGLPFTLGYFFKTFFLKTFLFESFGFFSVSCVFIGLLASVVYFYRLVFYACFDFYKNTKYPISFTNFKNKIISNANIKQLNLNSFFATFSLLLAGFIIVIVFYFIVIYTDSLFNMWDWNLNLYFTNKFELLAVYDSYLILFYAYYWIVIVLLFLVTWRKNSFFFQMITILIWLGVGLIVIKVWGQIMTEANTLKNFNFGFSTHKSDVLIHLSQWQYWWWFWFAFFWTFYLFVITRFINKRVQQFNPILNTSTRGHGKWGDFLVVLIPLTWCGNILVNSNFILRMIEWQNESSLFTLHIQGKQWYWVYKINGAAAHAILAAPKNIGNNNWWVQIPGESFCADNYYQALHLGAQLEFKKLYAKSLEDNKIVKDTTKDLDLKGNLLNYIDSSFDKTLKNRYETDFLQLKDSLNYSMNVETALANHIKNLSIEKLTTQWDSNVQKVQTLYTKFDDYPKFMDTWETSARILPTNYSQPLIFQKGWLNEHVFDLIKNSVNDEELTKNVIFKSKINRLNELSLKNPESVEVFWGFKQKRYKRFQKIKFSKRVYYNTDFTKKVDLPSTSPFILKSQIIDNSEFSSSNDTDKTLALKQYHLAIKYNRHRSELVPVNLARRLLRTKRTLVLPAHVNITAITNSYDVVHSWFIPGLGLKLDCVPGRSTHHTFYIDNVGFYYGQCAEICGRYHHHMPIRICALPFEQFLVWWQKKGLKRLHRLRFNATMQATLKTKDTSSKEVAFRYRW